MELWINGKQVDSGWIQPDMNLRRLLELTASYHMPPGEAIFEIVVDGTPVNVDEERERGTDPVGGIGRLEIKSRDPRRLALESLMEGADYLNRLTSGLVSVAEYYRAGDAVEGSRLLALATEGIQGFRSLIENVEVFIPVDYAKDEVEGTTVLECYEALQSIIEKLSRYQEEQNWTAMGDLIQGELIPYFKKWGPILDWMIQRCERREAGA